MSIEIRSARIDDIDWIVKELEGFAKPGSKKQLFNKERTEVLVKKTVCTPCFFVAEKNKVPAGFIAGILHEEIKLLAEMFWWVSAPYRRTRISLLLLNKFLEYGKQNADWIIFGLEAASPIRDETLFKRGFKLMERHFLMET